MSQWPGRDHPRPETKATNGTDGRHNGVVTMVGLTGGVGAGKSSVSARLAGLGAVIVDSDLLAREVVMPGTPGLAEIVAAFGEGVLADGALDRPALGRLVFHDAEARARLEAIVHPRVRARSAEIIHAAPDGAVIVNDIPLLVETGMQGLFNLVVVVAAPVELRVERLRGRGMSEADARSRIAAQATDEQRAAAADVVIDNDGSLADLHAKVDELWRMRLDPAREGA
jgi:dephospho-CoA kinase